MKQDVPIGNHKDATKVVDLPSDDVRMQRAREVLDRLAYAAGLENEVWEIVVADIDGRVSSCAIVLLHGTLTDARRCHFRRGDQRPPGHP